MRALCILFFLYASSLFSQIEIKGKSYSINKSEAIYLPLGKISFADEVVEFIQGRPHASKEFSDPRSALGEPNYTHYKVPNYISLGCGGVLVLEFTDNGFVDMEGPDIYIWEVGPSAESFQLEISKDGETWLNLGTVSGGRSFVDIAPVVEDIRDIFYFVRITDLKDICSGVSPGVDIDAVGTISGVIKINLSSDVLFDFDKFQLKETSMQQLDSLAYQINKVGMAEIIVAGHTDSIGSYQYNLALSEKRAQSVVDQLKQTLVDENKYLFQVEAWSFSQPRDTNETEEGRQHNRRVEIIVKPHRDFYKKKK